MTPFLVIPIVHSLPPEGDNQRSDIARLLAVTVLINRSPQRNQEVCHG